jgi:hypothetical protein
LARHQSPTTLGSLRSQTSRTGAADPANSRAFHLLREETVSSAVTARRVTSQPWRAEAQSGPTQGSAKSQPQGGGAHVRTAEGQRHAGTRAKSAGRGPNQQLPDSECRDGIRRITQSELTSARAGQSCRTATRNIY